MKKSELKRYAGLVLTVISVLLLFSIWVKPSAVISYNVPEPTPIYQEGIGFYLGQSIIPLIMLILGLLWVLKIDITKSVKKWFYQ